MFFVIQFVLRRSLCKHRANWYFNASISFRTL